MKKAYTKPALYAESFQLVGHIAKCDGVRSGGATFNDTSDCAFHIGNDPGNMTVFVLAGTCDMIYDSELDGYSEDCYNGLFGATNVTPFSS